jgi:hypothetical protein
MNNSLLAGDSNYKKRTILQSVRSYLDNEGKSITISSKPQPKTILDSPPEKTETRGTFGRKFRDLLHPNPNQPSTINIKGKRSKESDDSERKSDTDGQVNKKLRSSLARSQSIPRSPPRDRPYIPRSTPREQSSLPQSLLIDQPRERPQTHTPTPDFALQKPTSAVVGFATLKWRERVQSSFISTTTPDTAAALPPRPSISTRTKEPEEAANVKTVKKSQSKRNVVPTTSEVSLNFVRKDLKRRGSYKFKGGEKSRRAKTREMIQSRGDHSLPASSIQNNKSEGTTDGSVRECRLSGLSVFGLDPFHLYLENTRTKTKETSLREVSPPLCPGHQMAAKLLTVKKAGLNKVTIPHSFNLIFHRGKSSSPAPTLLINAANSFFGKMTIRIFFSTRLSRQTNDRDQFLPPNLTLTPLC